MEPEPGMTGPEWRLLETPVPLVDLDQLEDNIARMAAHTASLGLALRPHVKTHKSPWIAQAQRDAGAQGLTCATLQEAEAMASSTSELLLAHPPVHPSKLRRLVTLPDHLDLLVGIDSEEAVNMLGQAADSAGRKVRILLEADVGLRRVGVGVPGDLIRLAEAVSHHRRLELAGMMFYPGHIKGGTNGQGAALETLSRDVSRFVNEAAAAGFPLSIVSGGSTPTVPHFGSIPAMTEVRPGTYVYNDRITVASGACLRSQCALTVLATVVSTSVRDQAVVDAGSKALGREPAEGVAGFGELLDHPEVPVVRLSEEHGILDLSATDWKPVVGEPVRIIPNHVCIVVHLNDGIFGTRGKYVERGWTLPARGRGYRYEPPRV